MRKLTSSYRSLLVYVLIHGVLIGAPLYARPLAESPTESLTVVEQALSHANKKRKDSEDFLDTGVDPKKRMAFNILEIMYEIMDDDVNEEFWQDWVIIGLGIGTVGFFANTVKDFLKQGIYGLGLGMRHLWNKRGKSIEIKVFRERYKSQLEEIERLAKLYLRTRERFKNGEGYGDPKHPRYEQRKAGLDAIGKQIIKKIQEIANAETKRFKYERSRQKPTLFQNKEDGRLQSQGEQRHPRDLHQDPKKALKQIKTHVQACDNSLAQLSDAGREMNRDYLSDFAPVVGGTIFTTGTAYGLYRVSEYAKKTNGISVQQQQTEEIVDASRRLGERLDFYKELERLPLEKKKVINDFYHLIFETLRSEQDTIVDYFEQQLPEELKEMLNVRTAVENKLKNEDDAVRKEMGKSLKKIIPEFKGNWASPDDFLKFLSNVEEDSGTMELFLIDFYTEVIHRRFPRLQFKNTTNSARMLLLSPLLDATLQKTEALKQEIRQLQEKEKTKKNGAAGEGAVTEAGPRSDAQANEIEVNESHIDNAVSQSSLSVPVMNMSLSSTSP